MIRKRPQAFKPYILDLPKKEENTNIIRFDTQASTNDAIDLEKHTNIVSDLSDLGVKNSLPFIAEVYNISSSLEDYVFVPTPICPSDLPNRNGIGFPISELVKFRPYPIFRQVYKVWAGAPVHIEHDNEDHTKAIGVVFDTILSKVEGYNKGKFWKVMGLIGVDKTKSPKYAQALLDDKLKTFSMGANALELRCSVCNALAYREQYRNCPHITSTDTVNFKRVFYNGKERLAYLNAYDLNPFELSVVASPAWTSAASDIIL